MPYINPGWTNGSEPGISKTNLDNISNNLANAVLFVAQILSTSQQDVVKENIAALSYNAQTLTTEQINQVLSNISALTYNAQTLTTGQKAQVRSNIGAQSTPTFNTSVASPSTLTIADNNIYVLTNVTSCTLTYPVGNFISTIRFTTASSGTVSSALVFPSGTRYMGIIPTYANSLSYECSIMSAGGLPVAIISAIGAGT
jgi:hypothetical protein